VGSSIAEPSKLPYIDAPFCYVFPQGQGNFFTLGAGVESRGNQESIYSDANFVWRATQFALNLSSGNTFQFQFADQAEKIYSNGYIDSSQLGVTTAGLTPYPQFPEVEFPAGGGIYVNLLNPFGGSSIFQLIFKGCKRFYDLEKACKMLPQRLYNPYAQPGLNGVNANSPDDDYVDVDTAYVYNSPIDFTGELVGQQLTLSGDSDFALRAIEVSLATGGSQTLLRFYNNQGYYLSDNYIDSSLYNSILSQPFVVFPEMLFAASSRIMIDLNNVNTSGGTQTVTIVFRGVKRYRASNLRRAR
jgi:hypothetical protein